ncbi:hypothetical protein MXB_1193, partial [Myxobolus squamalis]
YSAQGYDIGKLNNKSFVLVEFDQLKYKNVFIITNGNNKWALAETQVFGFTDKGGNVFIVGSHESGRELSRLVTGFGFVDRKENALVDHAPSLISEEYTFPKTVLIDAKKYSCASPAIFRTPLQPILYRGRGFGIDLTNPTTFAILTASKDSYLFNSANFADDSSLAVGTSAILVGGVEMRNSARAVLMGSVDALSDKWIYFSHDRIFFSTIPHGFDQRKFLTVQPGNLAFFTSLCEWAFQRNGVLRVLNPSHTLVSSGTSLDEYIVETLLEYSITVQQLDNGIWKPYVVDDMQLEVTRLTTFGRVTYNSTTDGVYTARFYAPDFIGIYGLHTRYRKLGFTTLDHQVKIIIRPRRHNDYDRIIRGAWPYYLTAFLMML